jgi:hypothetical protein
MCRVSVDGVVPLDFSSTTGVHFDFLCRVILAVIYPESTAVPILPFVEVTVLGFFLGVLKPIRAFVDRRA